MAGVSGPSIGLNAQMRTCIATAQAKVDGTTTCRGSTENFIGFGYSATSQEPLPQDFSDTGNTVEVTRAIVELQEPTYTAIPGNTLDETLLWATPAP